MPSFISQANEMLQAAKISQSPTERRRHLMEALRVSTSTVYVFYVTVQINV